MLKRVSWGAVIAVAFTLAALVFAALDEGVLALTCALCAIAWAILSLKERT
jgi:hypothetical protein